MKAKANTAVSRALSALVIVPLVAATAFAPAFALAQRDDQTRPPVSDDRTRDDDTQARDDQARRDEETRQRGDDTTRDDGTRDDRTRTDGGRDDGSRNDGTRSDGRGGGVDKVKASNLLARVTKTQSLFEQYLAKVAELRKELETRAAAAGEKLDFTAVDAKMASVEKTYAELEGKITVFVLQVNNTSEMPSTDPFAQFKQISTGFRTLFTQVFSLSQDMKALWQKLPADSRPVQSETRPGGGRDGRVTPAGGTRPGSGGTRPGSGDTRPGTSTRPTLPPLQVKPTRQIMPPVQPGNGR